MPFIKTSAGVTQVSDAFAKNPMFTGKTFATKELALAGGAPKLNTNNTPPNAPIADPSLPTGFTAPGAGNVFGSKPAGVAPTGPATIFGSAVGAAGIGKFKDLTVGQLFQFEFGSQPNITQSKKDKVFAVTSSGKLVHVPDAETLTGTFGADAFKNITRFPGSRESEFAFETSPFSTGLFADKKQSITETSTLKEIEAFLEGFPGAPIKFEGDDKQYIRKPGAQGFNVLQPIDDPTELKRLREAGIVTADFVELPAALRDTLFDIEGVSTGGGGLGGFPSIAEEIGGRLGGGGKEDIIQQLIDALTRREQAPSSFDIFQQLQGGSRVGELEGTIGTFDQELEKSRALLNDLETRLLGGLAREEARLAPQEIIKGRQAELGAQARIGRQDLKDVIGGLQLGRGQAEDVLGRERQDILTALGLRQGDIDEPLSRLREVLGIRGDIEGLFGADAGSSEGIINAIIQNPQLFDQLTPSQKQQIIPQLSQKGFDFSGGQAPGPRPIPGIPPTTKTTPPPTPSSGFTLSQASDSTLNVIEGIQSISDQTPSVQTKTTTELRKLGFFDNIPPQWFIDFVNSIEQADAEREGNRELRIISPQEMEARWEEERQLVIGGGSSDSGRTP